MDGATNRVRLVTVDRQLFDLVCTESTEGDMWKKGMSTVTRATFYGQNYLGETACFYVRHERNWYIFEAGSMQILASGLTRKRAMDRGGDNIDGRTSGPVQEPSGRERIRQCRAKKQRTSVAEKETLDSDD